MRAIVKWKGLKPASVTTWWKININIFPLETDENPILRKWRASCLLLIHFYDLIPIFFVFIVKWQYFRGWHINLNISQMSPQKFKIYQNLCSQFSTCQTGEWDRIKANDNLFLNHKLSKTFQFFPISCFRCFRDW